MRLSSHLNFCTNRKDDNTFLIAILLTGLTLVERNKNVLVTRERSRQKEWEWERSCWRVEISTASSSSQCYHHFHTSAVASSCKRVPALPRSPHTKPSLSQVQAGEQWTAAYAVHKKPGQRHVARSKLRPSGTVAITVGAGHVEASVLTRTLLGAMCVEQNEHRTLVLQCLSVLLLPEVSFPLLPWEWGFNSPYVLFRGEVSL